MGVVLVAITALCFDCFRLAQSLHPIRGSEGMFSLLSVVSWVVLVLSLLSGALGLWMILGKRIRIKRN